jgi:nucleotide-binding universal stress UspA family protein
VPAFKNILLPIDLSSNADLAVRKAIDLIDHDGSVVHLFHVAKSKGLTGNGYPEEQHFKLLQWKKLIEAKVPGAIANISITNGHSIERAIAQKAIEVNPELILIAKHSNKKIFSLKKTISSGSLAKRTKCAVLTAKPGSLDKKIKSIVIPVQSRIPKRKLELLVPLAWKRNTTVYLVSMLNKLKSFDNYDSSVSHTLVETYRLLKDGVNCQVFHKLVSGHNIARSILRFAESVNADVLVVNPEETRISSVARLDITDMLMRNSKLQLLTIAPDKTNL